MVIMAVQNIIILRLASYTYIFFGLLCVYYYDDDSLCLRGFVISYMIYA